MNPGMALLLISCVSLDEFIYFPPSEAPPLFTGDNPPAFAQLLAELTKPSVGHKAPYQWEPGSHSFTHEGSGSLWL
jgi:hypothetical protein